MKKFVWVSLALAATILAGCGTTATQNVTSSSGKTAINTNLTKSGTSMDMNATGTIGSTGNSAKNSTNNVKNESESATNQGPDQKPVPMKMTRDGQNVTIEMTTEETNVDVGGSSPYHAWAFDGTIPGPVIYLEQGDHVTLTVHNIDSSMPHSIDLHAALVAPNKEFLQVMPNESKTLQFTAELPGVYMYHCATPPMLMHIGNGMYGAVVITPKGTAKPDYTIVQSDLYYNGDYQRMKDGNPDMVVFNGKANQYVSKPLAAKVGKPLYIAFVNAGPNVFSAFHVVGTVFDDVEATGNPKNHLYDVQTYTVAPGDGALFKVSFQVPGVYPFVSHSMASADKGAMGKIAVTN